MLMEEAHLHQDLLPSCRTPVSEVEAYPEAATVTRPHVEPADEPFCLRELTPTRCFHLRRVQHLFHHTDSEKYEPKLRSDENWKRKCATSCAGRHSHSKAFLQKLPRVPF